MLRIGQIPEDIKVSAVEQAHDGISVTCKYYSFVSVQMWD